MWQISSLDFDCSSHSCATRHSCSCALEIVTANIRFLWYMAFAHACVGLYVVLLTVRARSGVQRRNTTQR